MQFDSLWQMKTLNQARRMSQGKSYARLRDLAQKKKYRILVGLDASFTIFSQSKLLARTASSHVCHSLTQS